MTNPNAEPAVEAEPQQLPSEAAAVVIDLASRQSEPTAPVVETPLPRRFTDSWALEGPHRGWLGFNSQTGEPK